MTQERTALEHRWNVEAARAGFAGSEYIDDPERVFARVRQERELAAKWRSELARLRRGGPA